MLGGLFWYNLAVQTAKREQLFTEWSELLWQSWSGSLAELTDRECLELFVDNAKRKNFLHLT
jgi:hypothetical protein